MSRLLALVVLLGMALSASAETFRVRVQVICPASLVSGALDPTFLSRPTPVPCAGMLVAAMDSDSVADDSSRR